MVQQRSLLQLQRTRRFLTKTVRKQTKPFTKKHFFQQLILRQLKTANISTHTKTLKESNRHILLIISSLRFLTAVTKTARVRQFTIPLLPYTQKQTVIGHGASTILQQTNQSPETYLHSERLHSSISSGAFSNPSQ